MSQAGYDQCLLTTMTGVDVNARKTSETSSATIAFSVLLRGALPPTVATGLLAAVVLGLVNGPVGGVSALVGATVVIAFFASGLLAVSRVVVDTGNPMLFMAVGMAVYFAQVLALFGVLVVAGQVESFDSRSAGIAMFVCVLVWQVAQMRAWRRARVPVYDNITLPISADGHPSVDRDEPTR